MATEPLAASTTVVIPAFNEAAAIGRVVARIRGVAAWREVLVVDDGSSDETAASAVAAGARVVRHPYNKGNGAAVKTGIRESAGSAFVLIMDADGQHRPEDALRLVTNLQAYDLVVGARSPDTQAGTVRRVGNAALNAVASYLAEHHIPDLTSGFRAARRSVLLEFLHLLPNGFSTPTTTTLACIRAGYSVRFEPIAAERREGSSKIRLSRDGVKFLLILLKVVTIYSPLRLFLPISALSFLLGAAYAVWTIATQAHVTNSSVLLILMSVVILLVGLVSEQVSALRFEGPRS